MAAAAVLSPSTSSGLSTPSEIQYDNTTENSKMHTQAPPNEIQNFLTSKMVAVLKDLAYETSSINTLITRADTNTILATAISPSTLLDADIKSISQLLEETLLNKQTLREQNIYLNSNEPVLLIDVPEILDLSTQQVNDLKGKVLVGLRDQNIKPVRVYIRETNNSEDQDSGLSFSLLNVVNSDIGINMVSLLDRAFYGSEWKEDLIVKEGWNGYDLIWRDEAWRNSSTKEVQEEVAVVVEPERFEATKETRTDTDEVFVDESVGVESKQEPIQTGTAGAELERMPSGPVRSVSYKSADDVPEDTDEEEPEAVQHPALKELLERDAQKPPVQHPTWSRPHDGEAYLDIIKTHSRGQEETEPTSTIPRSEEKDDFEVVDKP